MVVASRNAHKFAEFSRILPADSWELVSLDDAGFEGDLDEPFDTYAENARAKALTVAEALGASAISDDSGIEIIALDGWPGIKSARWLGGNATDTDRLEALVSEVERRSPGDRRARYVCAVAVATPAGEVTLAIETVDGEIVNPAGTRGFGYDPAFYSPELGKTFAEASEDEKDRVSHRGRALRAIVALH